MLDNDNLYKISLVKVENLDEIKIIKLNLEEAINYGYFAIYFIYWFTTLNK